MKKYCENCRYYSPSFWGILHNGFFPASCSKVISIEKYKTRETSEKKSVDKVHKETIWKNIEKYNKDNSCKYYKRKILYLFSVEQFGFVVTLFWCLVIALVFTFGMMFLISF